MPRVKQNQVPGKLILDTGLFFRMDWTTGNGPLPTGRHGPKRHEPTTQLCLALQRFIEKHNYDVQLTTLSRAEYLRGLAAVTGAPLGVDFPLPTLPFDDEAADLMVHFSKDGLKDAKHEANKSLDHIKYDAQILCIAMAQRLPIVTMDPLDFKILLRNSRGQLPYTPDIFALTDLVDP
jgi:predicted nucleic acid-binding protein